MPKSTGQILRSCSNGLVSVITCGAAVPGAMPIGVPHAEAKMLRGTVMQDVRVLMGTARRTMRKAAGQAALMEAGDYSARIAALSQRLQSVRAQMAAKQVEK